MAQDLVLNELLKKIWVVDEKIVTGQPVTQEEKDFYNEHLSTIQNYYSSKSEYWNGKKPV